MTHVFANDDSRREVGGRVPDAPGMPAFALRSRTPSAIPVLIAVPHAGRSYPETILTDLRHGESAALRLEDRHADTLARGIAAATGADLLIAYAPRAMIDLNRSPDDVDWEMFTRSGRPEPVPELPGLRARSGLGIVPRRLPGAGELWRRKLDPGELAERVEHIHRPYHELLARQLVNLRERWGAALLVDLHSMPPLPIRSGAPPVELVLGDRFGASCHGSVVAAAFSELTRAGREVTHNRPYAGGYVLERHASPADGIHALQVEVDRRGYLDPALSGPGEGMRAMVEDLAALVRRLAGTVSELGRDTRGIWPLAAE